MLWISQLVHSRRSLFTERSAVGHSEWLPPTAEFLVHSATARFSANVTGRTAESTITSSITIGWTLLVSPIALRFSQVQTEIGSCRRPCEEYAHSHSLRANDWHGKVPSSSEPSCATLAGWTPDPFVAGPAPKFGPVASACTSHSWQPLRATAQKGFGTLSSCSLSGSSARPENTSVTSTRPLASSMSRLQEVRLRFSNMASAFTRSRKYAG